MTKTNSDARQSAYAVLAQVRGGSFASVALEAQLSGLTSRDRALCTELVYGCLRHRTRLDLMWSAHKTGGGRVSAKLKDILRVACYQLRFLDSVPDHAVVDEAVTQATRVGGRRVSGFVNAVLRKVIGAAPIVLRSGATFQDTADYYSLPLWLAEELRSVVSDEWEAAARALNQPARPMIRCNFLRGSLDELEPVLADEMPGIPFERIDGSDVACCLAGLGKPNRYDSFARGLWTVQDIASQRAVELLAPRAGEMVLDACSGRGGKAFYAAALMGNDGSISCVDSSARRIAEARDSAKRLGVSICSWEQADLRSFGTKQPYDAVFVDTPCSGAGVIRRHPEKKWQLTPSDVEALVSKQYEILKQSAAAVAPGGRLVYAVCSFIAAETEDQVARFVAEHPEFALETELRTWPHQMEADAFYAAKLIRRT